MKKINQKGFTLIELMVVIAIIGLLSSIVLASLTEARSKARDSKRVSEMRNVEKALQIYALNNNGAVPISAFTDISQVPKVANVIDCNNASIINNNNNLYDTLIEAKALSGRPSNDPLSSKGYCYVYMTDGTLVSVLGASYNEYGDLISGKPIAALITSKVKNAVFFSPLENTKTTGGYKALVGVSLGTSVPIQLNVDLTTGVTTNTVYTY